MNPCVWEELLGAATLLPELLPLQQEHPGHPAQCPPVGSASAPWWPGETWQHTVRLPASLLFNNTHCFIQSVVEQQHVSVPYHSVSGGTTTCFSTLSFSQWWNNNMFQYLIIQSVVEQQHVSVPYSRSKVQRSPAAESAAGRRLGW